MNWNHYTHQELRAAEQAADKAERTADRSRDEVRQLQQQVERLTLACQSMWELLREQHGLSDPQLEAKILEVDLRDGKLDGKIGTQVIACPACNRPTNSKRKICMMCGAPLLGKKPHVFEG